MGPADTSDLIQAYRLIRAGREAERGKLQSQPPQGFVSGEDYDYVARRLSKTMTQRDRYWQALIDIAGLENWENKAAGDIAREALEPER